MVTQGSSTIQVVKLHRLKTNGSFGFSLRGGCEHGTGFYISDVDYGSEAEQKGLKVGDQILRVNGFMVDRATHQELLAVIKSKNRLFLKVKHAGMVPVKNHKRDPLTWRMIESSNDYVPAIYNLQHDEVIETEIFIDGTDGPAGLGCSIANGPVEKPGIFVQSTKIGGLAHAAGLRTGDQITKMNGTDLENMPFAKAVSLLKSSPHLKLQVLKAVGLDLFIPEITQHHQNFIHRNGYNGSSENSAVDVPISNEKHSNRLSPFSSNCDDSSSHNSSDHLTSDREVTSSVDTRSSLSDDQPCSSSDDAGSLTSSEAYGAPLVLGRWAGTDSLNSISSFRKEQERLAMERKRLEEGQLKLQQETEQLTKEKQKLEDDKKKQLKITAAPLAPKPLPLHSSPENKPFVMPTNSSGKNFLSELREKSFAREQRSLEGSSISSRSASPRENSKHRGFFTDSEGEVFGEDFQKRKQHEKLMKEFREAHQKMFKKGNSEGEDAHCDSNGEVLQSGQILANNANVSDSSKIPELTETFTLDKEPDRKKLFSASRVMVIKDGADSQPNTNKFVDDDVTSEPSSSTLNGQSRSPLMASSGQSQSKKFSSVINRPQPNNLPSAVLVNGESQPIIIVPKNCPSKPGLSLAKTSQFGGLQTPGSQSEPSPIPNGSSDSSSDGPSKPLPTVAPGNGQSKHGSIASQTNPAVSTIIPNAQPKALATFGKKDYSEETAVTTGFTKPPSPVIISVPKPAPTLYVNDKPKVMSTFSSGGQSKAPSTVVKNAQFNAVSAANNIDQPRLVSTVIPCSQLKLTSSSIVSNGHSQNDPKVERKVLRRNVKCPAPPPPPQSPEKRNSSPTSSEKRVTIVPEATNIVTSANKEDKVLNRHQNKTSIGILKKSSTYNQNNATIGSKNCQSQIKFGSFPENVKSETDTSVVIPNRPFASYVNTSTVKVTISSYPDGQPNRFISSPSSKKNMTTRVTLNGSD